MWSPAQKKRVRTDGQISREEYDHNNGQQPQGGSAGAVHGFARADAATLAGRRMVTGTRRSKRDEFLRMVRSLNQNFAAWVAEELSASEGADLTAGVLDYIAYVDKLEGRYLRGPGMVLTFGNGDCGQLAHGDESDADLNVKYPRIVESLRDRQVAAIACGGLHNIVCMQDGSLWSWGCNDDGALGRSGSETQPLRVSEVLGDDSIVQVAAGDVQSMAVGLSGTVYGFGSYKDKEGKQWFETSGPGQSARDCKRKQTTPMIVPGLNGVVEVACGASFNLALTQDGAVYSWGIGETGELGRPVSDMKDSDGEYRFADIQRTHLTPQRMLDDKKQAVVGIKAIGCGAYHSLVVTAVDAHVMSTGLNNYGQLGHGDEVNRDTLRTIQALEGVGVTQVSGGMHHSLVLSLGSHRLLSFGRSDSGQLGCLDTIPAAGAFENLPREVSLCGEEAVSIACGANHSLALTQGGKLYSWGYGDMYALGHGNDKDQSKPRALNFSKAGLDKVKVQAFDGGGQHTALILGQGLISRR